MNEKEKEEDRLLPRSSPPAALDSCCFWLWWPQLILPGLSFHHSLLLALPLCLQPEKKHSPAKLTTVFRVNMSGQAINSIATILKR